MNTEVFYLSSMESRLFSITRECVVLKQLFFKTGKECVLVRINPVVVGQPFGLGEKDIHELVLSCRHLGVALVPVSEFPCFVHVARPLIENICDLDEISVHDVESIAWGELYRTRYDADNHVFEKRNRGGNTRWSSGQTPFDVDR